MSSWEFSYSKMVGNADARQSIFLRARLREYVPSFQGHALRVGFLRDDGRSRLYSNGPHWTYTDSPLMGLYFGTKVYSHGARLVRFQPWLDRVVNFPEEVVDDALGEDAG